VIRTQGRRLTPSMDRRRLHFLNSEALTTIFGRWPSFHDSEVVALRLNRTGEDAMPSVEIDIHLWETGGDVDAAGRYVTGHHTLAQLRFEDVDEVALEGFNAQNVLFDLEIEGPALDSQRWSVSLNASYGVSASFSCASAIVLRAQPFEPTQRDPTR